MPKKFDNVREIVEYCSEKYKNNLAFKLKIGKGKSAYYDEVTYERLRREVEELAKYFAAGGYENKRIAVIGKNSYEWVLVYLAALSVNSVIVPLDKELMAGEAISQLKRSEANAVFYDSEIKCAEEIAAFSEEGNIESFVLNRETLMKLSDAGKGGEIYKRIKVDSGKMSILLFTSGTTSSSKAVMLSQRNVMANIYAMDIWEDFRETDVNMAFLPLHHSFGMTQMVLFISCGMCTVFCRGLRIAQCLKEYNVSIFVCVPRVIEVMYDTIMKKLNETGKISLIKKGIAISGGLKKIGIDIRRKIFKELLAELGGALRLIIIGAAPVKPEVQKFFCDIGILSFQGYGMTETSPCISAENEKNLSFGSVGKPIPGVDVKIAEKDENGIGEITVWGENVMLGYYKEEKMTESLMTKFPGSERKYFRTGDMGYFNKKGLLFITGRKKNVIVLGNGENVFPEELEMLLSDCPEIKECVVYGKELADSTAVCAKIVCFEKTESACEAIKNYVDEVNQRLATYKRIKDFEITEEEFEKTTTLKIKRNL